MCTTHHAPSPIAAHAKHTTQYAPNQLRGLAGPSCRAGPTPSGAPLSDFGPLSQQRAPTTPRIKVMSQTPGTRHHTPNTKDCDTHYAPTRNTPYAPGTTHQISCET